MGQRSQIYVRFNQAESPKKKYLVARYFSWNFGERMVSRARYTMDWLEEMKSHLSGDNIEKLKRIIDTNFDYQDVVLSTDILKEYIEGYYDDFSDVFCFQANNDGQLLIDVTDDGIKYAFVSYLGESTEPMNPRQYMIWNHKGCKCEDWEKSIYIDNEQKKLCNENITHIVQNYKLMTQEEIEEFISYDGYEKDMELDKERQKYERPAVLIQNLVEMVRASGSYLYNADFEKLLTEATGITHFELVEYGVFNEEADDD